MNLLEDDMVGILKDLKQNNGVFEVKAEYENEGSRLVELMRLKDVTGKASLPIILKIGGVEAVTDMYDALSLGVKGIIAPMAETAFATYKFLNAIQTFIPEENQRAIDFCVNIETITAYKNIDDILNLKDINILTGLTVGRVDFSESVGANRNFVNNDTMLGYCKEIFYKARGKGLKTALGGAISQESIPFIAALIADGLIDKFETRKLVYSIESFDNIEEGLAKGIQFELLWLKSKRQYYHRIKNEDEKRIQMLEKRVFKKTVYRDLVDA
ncbi:MAG: aldolase/citrate lyase family protein [Legionellaceae bacterium]|nr:aldolase/citrate lyase family protein [Legionellaceae bacterium]